MKENHRPECNNIVCFTECCGCGPTTPDGMKRTRLFKLLLFNLPNVASSTEAPSVRRIVPTRVRRQYHAGRLRRRPWRRPSDPRSSLSSPSNPRCSCTWHQPSRGPIASSCVFWQCRTDMRWYPPPLSHTENRQLRFNLAMKRNPEGFYLSNSEGDQERRVLGVR